MGWGRTGNGREPSPLSMRLGRMGTATTPHLNHNHNHNDGPTDDRQLSGVAEHNAHSFMRDAAAAVAAAVAADDDDGIESFRSLRPPFSRWLSILRWPICRNNHFIHPPIHHAHSLHARPPKGD